jgi:hypothetical protein
MDGGPLPAEPRTTTHPPEVRRDGRVIKDFRNFWRSSLPIIDTIPLDLVRIWP